MLRHGPPVGREGRKSGPNSWALGTGPKIDFVQRRVNRSLNTDKLLALLKSEASKFFPWPKCAGELLKIEVLDHVVMGNGNFSSLRSHEYISP